MNVILFSFGYKHEPPEADTVIDVRFLPNPYYIPELSKGTGQDTGVVKYVLDNPVAKIFFQHFQPFILNYIHKHADSNRSEFRLAVGCTGGRHRSVAVLEKLRHILEMQGVTVELYHRDIDKV